MLDIGDYINTHRSGATGANRRVVLLAGLSACILSGCQPGNYGVLGELTTYESRMVDIGLAPDIPSAHTMIARYREYIDISIETDNDGILWNNIRGEYGHDEIDIFRFLRKEGFFRSVNDNFFYKRLLSREAHAR